MTELKKGETQGYDLGAFRFSWRKRPAGRAVQCYEQILGFSFSNTILFLKNVDCEKDVSFCEQKTEYLGLKNRIEQPLPRRFGKWRKLL